MAYKCPSQQVCPRVNYWSNPARNYTDGKSMGTADKQNNARVLNERAPILAAFRDATVGNRAPVVNAGTAISVPAVMPVQLSGTAYDDGVPVGSKLATVWTVAKAVSTVDKYSNGSPASLRETNAVIAAPGAVQTTFIPGREGVYTLRLTATDSLQTSASDVVVTVANNAAPVAAFAATASGLTVQFTDGSSDADGAIASRSWELGDGQSSSVANPTHNYASAGTYVVKLTVTDDKGASNTVQKTVVVTVPNKAPTANFSAATSDLKVTFTDASTDTDGAVASWKWDFGDLTGSVEKNPVKIYATAGTYTATLTVTDDKGATSNVQKTITVIAANKVPVANFNLSVQNLKVTFTDGSSDTDGKVVGWNWNFGDGTSSTLQNPVKSYGAAGNYSVTLVVTDDKGASSTAVSRTVTTTAIPTAPVANVLVENTVGGDREEIRSGRTGTQSFRLGGVGSRTLTKLVVYVSRTKTAPTANFSINLSESLTGVALNGSTLSVSPAQITNTSAGTGFQRMELNFQVPVTVQAGKTYFLRLASSTINGQEYFIEESISNQYSGGAYYRDGVEKTVPTDLRFSLIGY